MLIQQNHRSQASKGGQRPRDFAQTVCSRRTGRLAGNFRAFKVSFHSAKAVRHRRNSKKVDSKVSVDSQRRLTVSAHFVQRKPITQRL
jgi:hypothetical protein